MINHSSPREIETLLSERGLVPHRRFGQNFLINPGARRTILSRASAGPCDTIWEIGAGIGTLTTGLIPIGTSLVLFEIDRGFVELLEDFFGKDKGVEIVPGDFVTTWPSSRDKAGDPDLIVGNLPYGAAAKIIVELFEATCGSRLLFMVQREAALRMCAKPGDSDYSSYSIICQIGWEIERVTDFQPGSFYPKPGVVSTLVEMRPTETTFPFPRGFVLSFCRCLFAARRKTVANNLLACSSILPLGQERVRMILSRLHVDEKARAEDLGSEEVIRLATQCFRALP